jgi:hypothetical protein
MPQAAVTRFMTGPGRRAGKGGHHPVSQQKPGLTGTAARAHPLARWAGARGRDRHPALLLLNHMALKRTGRRVRHVIGCRGLQQLLEVIDGKASQLLTGQADLAARVTGIAAGVDALAAAAGTIETELAALQAANPALDLTGLNTAVADLGSVVHTVTQIAPSPAAS